MPTPLRRRLRLARRGLWYVLAGGLVLMALTASVVSQLLPLAERHPDRIAAWLSERSGRTVTFDKVGDAWTVTRSQLDVVGVVPGMDEAAFDAEAAATGQACPISRALKGNVEISVQATLEEEHQH